MELNKLILKYTKRKKYVRRTNNMFFKKSIKGFFSLLGIKNYLLSQLLKLASIFL